MNRLFAIFAAATLTLAGCGKSNIGEKCNTAGSLDECESGAVCTNSSDGNFCRKVCGAQSDCASNESCKGVSGTTYKSCQPN